jgi:hypothetical protein
MNMKIKFHLDFILLFFIGNSAFSFMGNGPANPNAAAAKGNDSFSFVSDEIKSLRK